MRERQDAAAQQPRSLKGVTQKDDSRAGERVRSHGRRGNGKFNYRRSKDDERANTETEERQNNLWKEGAADSAAAVFSFTRPQEFSLRPRFPAVPTTSKFTYLSIEQRLLLPKLLLGVVFERLGRNRRWSTRRV